MQSLVICLILEILHHMQYWYAVKVESVRCIEIRLRACIAESVLAKDVH